MKTKFIIHNLKFPFAYSFVFFGVCLMDGMAQIPHLTFIDDTPLTYEDPFYIFREILRKEGISKIVVMSDGFKREEFLLNDAGVISNYKSGIWKPAKRESKRFEVYKEDKYSYDERGRFISGQGFGRESNISVKVKYDSLDHMVFDDAISNEGNITLLRQTSLLSRTDTTLKYLDIQSFSQYGDQKKDTTWITCDWSGRLISKRNRHQSDSIRIIYLNDSSYLKQVFTENFLLKKSYVTQEEKYQNGLIIGYIDYTIDDPENSEKQTTASYTNYYYDDRGRMIKYVDKDGSVSFTYYDNDLIEKVVLEHSGTKTSTKFEYFKKSGTE